MRNTVRYNDNVYGTLSGYPVDGTTNLCQGNSLPLPRGCRVAPDTAESRAVVGNHNWNTPLVVLGSGKVYCTKNFAETDGNRFCRGLPGGPCVGCSPNNGGLTSSNGKFGITDDLCASILYQCTTTPGCLNRKCAAHTKCPAGKYTNSSGSATAQPTCEACMAGFFKAFTSKSSTVTDLCTAHTKCPPGKYTVSSGSATAEPKCDVCAAGFFKVLSSNSSNVTDSCTAHTKCPPGKYTTATGSATVQPTCGACAIGFFKSSFSKRTTCVGTALPPDKVLWTKVTDQHCVNNVFARGYSNLAQAQAACLNVGPRCLGVEDLGCDGRNEFYVCTAGTIGRSNVGSCVYTLAENGCPFEWCGAHAKCPADKYTKTAGSATVQPQCEVCPAGLFKSLPSSSTTKTDSCTSASPPSGSTPTPDPSQSPTTGSTTTTTTTTTLTTTTTTTTTTTSTSTITTTATTIIASSTTTTATTATTTTTTSASVTATDASTSSTTTTITATTSSSTTTASTTSSSSSSSTTSTSTGRGSWMKTKGACRYSDGSSFNAVASSKATAHAACKEFCIKNSKCDAFDTDGGKCVLFQHQDGKTHTGNGKGNDFCYIRGLSQGGSWIKTKGACRYSDGSFNAFASSKATTHDACKEFCVKNSKCDAFATDGDKCVLFQHQDGKTHTGNGEGTVDYCYVRDSSSSSSTTTTAAAAATATTTTAIVAASKDDGNIDAVSNPTGGGAFTSVTVAVIAIVAIIAVVMIVGVISILIILKQSRSNMHTGTNAVHEREVNHPSVEMAVLDQENLNNENPYVDEANTNEKSKSLGNNNLTCV